VESGDLKSKKKASFLVFLVLVVSVVEVDSSNGHIFYTQFFLTFWGTAKFPVIGTCPVLEGLGIKVGEFVAFGEHECQVTILFLVTGNAHGQQIFHTC
jgi:hypothetical protein